VLDQGVVSYKIKAKFKNKILKIFCAHPLIRDLKLLRKLTTP
jgi:hypothetical protein